MYGSVRYSRYSPLGREHAQTPSSFAWISTFSSQGIIINLITHSPKQILGHVYVERLWVWVPPCLLFFSQRLELVGGPDLKE